MDSHNTGTPDDGFAASVVARAISGHVTSAYQPIIDLGRGAVAGFEALLRYDDDAAPMSTPLLFASARRLGRYEELEATALRSALQARDSIPSGCFLSLNVGSGALADDAVMDVLRQQASLDGLVLELTDRCPTDILDAVDAITVCRERGASIAVAHDGLSYTDLQMLFATQPSFVKLDREVVEGISSDNVKLALVETIFHLGRRLGVRLVAQGIEDLADLVSLQRLGIELGQGFLLARPGPRVDLRPPSRMVFAGDTSVATIAGSLTNVSKLVGIVEHVDVLTEDDLDNLPAIDEIGITYEVIVDELRAPLALMRRSGRRVEAVPLTLIGERSTIGDVAQKALSRPPATRFDPLVCVDEFSCCVGVVRMERVMAALADAAAALPAPAGGATPATGVSAPAPHETGKAYGFRRCRW